MLLLASAVGFFLVGLGTFTILVKDGLGHAGYNPPIFWSVYITTFVFWIGIGHAGTLISAILFLFRSPWRTAVYRSTEAMTVFAVMTAGLFPIIHIGRQWIFYWLLPYPNQRFLWPNFKSPLLWDVFAISTYLTVSTTFLVFGLIPDVAAVRDKVTGWRRSVYALDLGGLAGHRQPVAALLPGLPLSGRAGDAAGALGALGGVAGTSRHRIVPGWHGTIFAPYFVAGAIYSGLGMVLTLIIPLRRALKIEHMITEYHFDNLAKLTLLTGSILFYAYGMEYFIAWYSGNTFEQTTFFRRAFGPHVVGRLDDDHLQRVRLPAALVPEDPHQPHRAVRHLDLHQHRDVVRALRDHRLVAEQRLHPVGLGQLNPTWADWGILAGSFGWFGMWFLLFAKNFPIVAIQEIKEMIPMPRKRREGTTDGSRAEVPARAGRAGLVHRTWTPRPTRSARSGRGGTATWSSTPPRRTTRSRRRSSTR